MAKSGRQDQKNSRNAAVSKVKPKTHRKKVGSRIGGRRMALNVITNKKLVQPMAASSQKKNLPEEDIYTEEDITEIIKEELSFLHDHNKCIAAAGAASMSYYPPEPWDGIEQLIKFQNPGCPLDYNIESEEEEGEKEKEEEESPMSYIPIWMRFRHHPSPLSPPFPRSPPLRRSPPFLIDMITLPLETIPEYEEIDDQV